MTGESYQLCQEEYPPSGLDFCLKAVFSPPSWSQVFRIRLFCFCFCFWQLSFALWSLQISGCRHYWKPAEAFQAFSVVLLWGLQRYLHWKSDSALALSECGTFRSTESRSTASLEASFYFHPTCNCKERDEKPCAALTCSFVFLIVAFPSHDQYTRVLLGSCWCSLKVKVVKLCRLERH